MAEEGFNVRKAIELMTESQRMDIVNWYVNTIADVPIDEVEFYLQELS